MTADPAEYRTSITLNQAHTVARLTSDAFLRHLMNCGLSPTDGKAIALALDVEEWLKERLEEEFCGEADDEDEEE